MHKPEFIPENETHETLVYKRITKYNVNKKKKIVSWCILLFLWTSEWKWKKWKERKIFRPCQNNVEYKSSSYTDCDWYTWNGPKWLEKVSGGIGNQSKNWDHRHYSISVTQTPVKDLKLKLTRSKIIMIVLST